MISGTFATNGAGKIRPIKGSWPAVLLTAPADTGLYADCCRAHVTDAPHRGLNQPRDLVVLTW